MVLQLSESEEHLRPTSPALPVKSNIVVASVETTIETNATRDTEPAYFCVSSCKDLHRYFSGCCTLNICTYKKFLETLKKDDESYSCKEQKLPKIKESDLHYLSAPRDKRRDLILRLPEPCKVPAVILVTGASKGIGLGFVKKFLAFEDVSIVIGTVRDNSGVQVQHIIGDQGINLLINNAGFCGKPDRSKINHSIAVNTIGPILVLQKFAKFLRNAAKRSAQLSVSVARAAFVNLAPVQSSLHANIYGSNFAGLQSCLVYAATKLTRGMSADLLPEGIMAVSMMPGSVKTALGGQNAELTVEQSCELMVSTLLKLQQHHSGEFLSLQGYKIEF